MPEILEQTLFTDFAKLTIAFLLTLPIAINRERATEIMGLRTFPLVAIATCGYVLIGQTFIDSSGDSLARILQGVTAGIGFIGGGAILKKEEKVFGTASAASIWTTGAIGVAVAFARFDIAIFLALSNYLILRWLTPLKQNSDSPDKESRNS